MSTEMLEQRLRRFAATVEEPDWEDVARRVRGPRISRARLTLALAVCVAGAIPAAVLGGAFGSSEPGAQTGPTATTVDAGGASGDTTGLWTNFGGNAFGADGRQITYDELVAGAPTISLPNSPLANADNVGTIWAVPEKVLRAEGLPDAGTRGLAAVVYYPSSGIELLWIPDLGYTAHPNMTIDGVDAQVEREVGQTNVARVILRSRGHRITLEGFLPRVTASELISVAQTLNPPPAP